jgi:hypothetical protein
MININYIYYDTSIDMINKDFEKFTIKFGQYPAFDEVSFHSYFKRCILYKCQKWAILKFAIKTFDVDLYFIVLKYNY